MIGKANRSPKRWQPRLAAANSLASYRAKSDGHDPVRNREQSKAGSASVCAEPTDLRIDDGALPQVGSGLSLLLESFRYAREIEADPWEFSVEWPELQRVGLTCNNARWLICNGLVHHADEVTGVKDEKRRFVSCPSLSLTGKTCFVLSPQGYRLACRLADLSRPVLAAVDDFSASCPSYSVSSDATDSLDSLTPKWDPNRRQLCLGNTIVKEFKLPAANQEIVLAVFEEEHWPPRIDDPLPQDSDIHPQRRLHDTINSLNRRQKHQLLHFFSDGLAQGIRWELVGRRASPKSFLSGLYRPR